MLRRVGSAAAALVVLATVVPATAAGRIARWTHRPAARYYLALGDSLAQGMQPDAAGVTRTTDQGYADVLFAAERARLPGLQLVNLACGGETSGSMITGRGNEKAARQSTATGPEGPSWRRPSAFSVATTNRAKSRC